MWREIMISLVKTRIWCLQQSHWRGASQIPSVNVLLMGISIASFLSNWQKNGSLHANTLVWLLKIIIDTLEGPEINFKKVFLSGLFSERLMLRKQSFWKAQWHKVMPDWGKSNSHSNLKKPTVGFRFGISYLKSTEKAFTHMVARMK